MILTFPAKAIAAGGTHAAIVTVNNQIHVHKVNPMFGRQFSADPFGDFQLQERYRYILGRGELYFYAQRLMNPYSLLGKLLIDEYLSARGQPHLMLAELAQYVEKIRRVEAGKVAVEIFGQLLNAKGKSPEEIEAELVKLAGEGKIDPAVTAFLSRVGPTAELDPRAALWLNDLFYEDVVSRQYLGLKQFTNRKFAVKQSRKTMARLDDRFGAKNGIALIIIDDRHIKVDRKISVDLKAQKLITSKHGEYEITSGGRYACGTQRVFIALHDSKEIIVPKPEAFAATPVQKKKTLLAIRPMWSKKKEALT